MLIFVIVMKIIIAVVLILTIPAKHLANMPIAMLIRAAKMSRTMTYALVMMPATAIAPIIRL